VIIGVGIDVVPVERFAESLTRTPGLRDRLFTAAEQLTPSGNRRTGESLAARFAAKEALARSDVDPAPDDPPLSLPGEALEGPPRGAPPRTCERGGAEGSFIRR